MGGILQIVGVLALLVGGCELLDRLLSRQRLVDQFRDAFGDVSAAPADDEPQRLREEGAL